MESQVGVTVGKFNPPHLGHLRLIETGASQVDHLYVLLGDHPDQTLPAADRARWLEEDVPPHVSIVITPDDLPQANEPWAQRALELLPRPPAVAFTSEPWGPGWAAAMGAAHVAVDPERNSRPISATRIRQDLRDEFHWLIPAARAALARRVVVVGAESTGKTTLARALASRLGTVWVPEYGRWYWEGRSYLADPGWGSAEFRRIAATHHRAAADLARRATRGVVILDTDALATAVWHRRYLGVGDPEVEAFAADHRPDHYLICSPDFPWVQDGTRESGAVRTAMHEATVELVQAGGVPFTVLEGDPDVRLEAAAAAIDEVTTFGPLT